MDQERKYPVKELCRMLDRLKMERRTFEPYWLDVKDYVVPHRGRFLSGEQATEVNNGARADRKIINGAATKALEVMTAGMQSGLTSKAREWFNLSHPNNRLNAMPEVIGYYKTVKQELLDAFDRSNLYNSLLDVYTEMGAFGTAVMAILPHPDRVFYFRTFTAGTYWLSCNNRQEVDAFFMVEYLTVRQMAEEYGVDRLSSRVREHYERRNFEERIKVYVAVLKNPATVGVQVPSGMPIAEIHFEDGTDGMAEQGRLLAVRGYRTFPVVAPRWSTVDRDVYGWSPTRAVLGNVKMLQQMERDKLQGLRKLVDPPLQGPSDFDRLALNASPGGYNTVYPGGDGIRPLYLVNPDIQSLNFVINQVVSDIQRGYYNDLFMMLQQKDTVNDAQMTAREVEERSWEKMLSLGPVLERIHYELLNPLIERSIQMLYFAGRIPEPPDALQREPSKVEYVSILSQAQKAVAVRKLESAASFVGGITGILPDAPKTLKTYEIIDAYNRAIGVDPDLQLTKEEFDQLVAQAAQAAQAAQQAQVGGDIAQSAKVASEIDAGGLNEVIQTLTGAGAGRMVL